MRILVVEDDEGIAEGLRTNLRQRGHVVDVCDGVERAWSALRVERFDAMLLDLGLPDGDGATVLQRLRSASPQQPPPDPAMPVVILTARDQVQHRIAGLDQGADDYLAKPFDVDELDARLRALQRRLTGRSAPLLRYRDVELDPAARTVRQAGVPVELSPREFSLLQLLLESQGVVLSRQQLEERLYDWRATVESNTVEVHVHHIRKKLGNQLIRTMRGVGYFVERLDPQ